MGQGSQRTGRAVKVYSLLFLIVALALYSGYFSGLDQFLDLFFVQKQNTGLQPSGANEEDYWLCTDLPQYTIPGTELSVHTPKDGETMNDACRPMDRNFFATMEKTAKGWVSSDQFTEKKVLGFMRWLDIDLPSGLSYRIGSTAVFPNLTLITIVSRSNSNDESPGPNTPANNRQ